MKRILALFACGCSASAAIYYADRTASGANNGTSWANAWTSIKSANGTAGSGDTVYISGGSLGSSKTYTNIDANWVRPSGVTFQTGQDAGHNGMVIFNGGTVQSGYQWMGQNEATHTFSGYVNSGGIDYTNMTITNYSGDAVLGDGGTGVKLRWMRIDRRGFHNFTTVNFVMDHVFVKVYSPSDNIGSWAGTPRTGTGFGLTVLSNCWFEIPRATDGQGWGADGMQNLYNFDCINCVFHGYDGGYPSSGQHQDALQSGLISSRIINCVFWDCANYAVYGDYGGGNVTDTLVLGCLFLRTQTSGGQAAVANGPAAGSTPMTISNVWCINNTVVDYTATGIGIAMGCSVSATAHWTNSYCLNNLFYNVGNPIFNTNLNTGTRVGVSNGWNLAIAGLGGGTGFVGGNKLADPVGSGTPAFAVYSQFGGMGNNYKIATNAYTGSNILAVLHSFQLTNLLSIDGANWESITTPYVGAYQTLYSLDTPAITLGPGTTLGWGMTLR